MARRKNRDDESSDAESSEDSNDYDEETNWAGGAGFDLGGEAHKWKSTRKFLCWPLYSESVTITAQELHIKRNDCPACPRECRPFRSWAVAPLRNIKSYYMRKTTTKPLDLCMLLVCAVIVGLIGGGIVSSLALPVQESLTGLDQASAVLGFNLDSSFFVFATVVGIAACMLGCLVLTLRAPLRLVVNVDGSLVEEFSIDLIPGRVQPEEIKGKIDEVLAGGGLGV
jgi:hypothetical protein